MNPGRLLIPLLSLLLMSAEASADRRSSFSGNLLIPDADDVFIYPQLAMRYADSVSFDIVSPSLEAAPARPGAATLILSYADTWAFGISGHRGDFYGATAHAFTGYGDIALYTGGDGRVATLNTISEASSLPPGVSSEFADRLLAPDDFLDVFGAFRIGDGLLGARLSVGMSKAAEETFGQTIDTSLSRSAEVVDLVLGYSEEGKNVSFDTNLEFSTAKIRVDASAGVGDLEQRIIGTLSRPATFAGSTRLWYPLRDAWTLGLLAVGGYTKYGVDQELQGSSDFLEYDAHAFLFEMGGGVKYEVQDRTIIAGYITLGSQWTTSVDERQNSETDGVERKEDSSAVYMFPSFKLAIEHWLTDWLCLRAGSQAKFFGQTDSTVVASPLEPDTTETYSSTTTRAFFGIGLKFGGLEFNGTFQDGMMVEGPYLVSGKEAGLFVLTSLAYRF